MRSALIALILVALASCSQPSRAPERRQPEPGFNVAYQATEGGLQGVYLFVDPGSGDTWSEYRDDREALAKGGFGDSLLPCSQGSIGCFRAWGQPLLSALPPPDFLNGEYRYSVRPRTYWAMPCSEISAASDRGTTSSVVCPVMGLVEFAVSTTGGPSPVERFQLRSFNGLFAQR